MTESLSSPQDLVYLKDLSDAEFEMFKEFLRHHLLNCQHEPIPWQIKAASKEELEKLLDRYYPRKQAWGETIRVLLQDNWKDTWEEAQQQMKSVVNTYKLHVKEKFQVIWDSETCLPVPEYFYKDCVNDKFEEINSKLCSDQKAVTVILTGEKGTGKTTFLQKMMLDWASGNFLKKRFSFVFFFYVYEMNTLVETSLEELISREWPDSSDSIQTIFAQPEKILFILDGFNDLKYDLEIGMNLCSDWRQRQPTQIILSSLLQKRLLPEASLLLELGSSSVSKIYYLLHSPKDLSLDRLSEDSKNLYISHFFRDEWKSRKVVQYFGKIPGLYMVCGNPRVCWMICSCFKWQLEKKEVLYIFPDNDARLYTYFIINAFKDRRVRCPTGHRRQRFKKLCTLAAEGTWAWKFVFSSEDLRRVDMSDSELSMWLYMRFLQKRGDNFVFHHHQLQAFCSILVYFFKCPAENTNPAIGNLAQLLNEVLAHNQTSWQLMGWFVFGLANPNTMSLLEPAFGAMVWREVRREIVSCLNRLSRGEHGEKLIWAYELFEHLFETQDEPFVAQVMNLFEELTMCLSEVSMLMTIAFSMRNCRNLKKLHLHVSGNIQNLEVGNMKHWNEVCSTFIKSRKFEALDLVNCTFDDVTIQVFHEVLSQPSCKLRSLSCTFMPSFGTGSWLFNMMFRTPYLRYLNLYGTRLSLSSIQNLCEVLTYPTCNVEELILGKCDITTDACKEITSVMTLSKLKHLSLVDNPLSNTGVMILCKALTHPKCMLKTLMLSHCCFSSPACEFISQVLLCNQYLSVLDLGFNFLGDAGVGTLCKALKHPSCKLQELWLSGCYLTPASCKDFSDVLTCNRNLKTLKLGKNDIRDTGFKQLCQALKHPNCKLERLGVEWCDLTTDCCSDLALVLTTCKLNSLNLECMQLDHDGLVVLCEALSQESCTLQTLGLEKSEFAEESQMLLHAVEEGCPHLNITHLPWAEEEQRMKGAPLPKVLLDITYSKRLTFLHQSLKTTCY